jgi:AcrR family transcriptional regulator
MSPPTVRDRLLEGAAEVLARRGFAGTTAREVATASGCNLRSIGYHYGSVRGLALAALSHNFRTWMAPLVHDDGSDPATAIRTGFERFTSELPRNAGLVRAWLEAVAAAQDDPELRAALAANQRWFSDALAERLAAAGVPDTRAAAAALITVCDGAMIRFLLHGEATPPGALLTDTVVVRDLLTASRWYSPRHRR